MRMRLAPNKLAAGKSRNYFFFLERFFFHATKKFSDSQKKNHA